MLHCLGRLGIFYGSLFFASFAVRGQPSARRQQVLDYVSAEAYNLGVRSTVQLGAPGWLVGSWKTQLRPGRDPHGTTNIFGCRLIEETCLPKVHV